MADTYSSILNRTSGRENDRFTPTPAPTGTAPTAYVGGGGQSGNPASGQNAPYAGTGGNTGYIPYAAPVAPQTATQPWQAQTAVPPAYQGPSGAPATGAGMFNQDGINQNWAYLTASKYNPQMNANLEYNYQEQLRQYAANGNRRWVGDNVNGHWVSDPPVPPIYTSTNFDDNLAMTNQNTPGSTTWGQATPGMLNPYVNQDPSYAGTLTPWTSANTNMNATYTSLLPDAGKPSTVNFPNGIAPGSGQGAYNMMGQDPNTLIYNGLMPDGSAPPNTNPNSTNAPPLLDWEALRARESANPQPNTTGPNNITPTAPPIPPAQSAQTPQQGTNPPPANQQQNSNANGLNQLLALLLGGGEKNASPFFNDTRSLYYPNTSRAATGQPPANTGNSVGNRDAMMALILAMLGGA